MSSISLREMERRLWRSWNWRKRLRYCFWKVMLWPEFQLERWRLRHGYGMEPEENDIT